jgi:hypothetical protein
MEFCPKCKSNNIRRSRTKGLREKFLKKLGWRAFRCRERDCRWRGLIQTKSLREPVVAFVELHKPKIIALLVVVILLISSGAGILLYLIN